MRKFVMRIAVITGLAATMTPAMGADRPRGLDVSRKPAATTPSGASTSASLIDAITKPFGQDLDVLPSTVGDALVVSEPKVEEGPSVSAGELTPMLDALRSGNTDLATEIEQRLRDSGIPEECLDAAQTQGVIDGSVPLAETACPNQVNHATPGEGLSPSQGDGAGLPDPLCAGRPLLRGPARGAVQDDRNTTGCDENGTCTRTELEFHDDGTETERVVQTHRDGSSDSRFTRRDPDGRVRAVGESHVEADGSSRMRIVVYGSDGTTYELVDTTDNNGAVQGTRTTIRPDGSIRIDRRTTSADGSAVTESTWDSRDRTRPGSVRVQPQAQRIQLEPVVVPVPGRRGGSTRPGSVHDPVDPTEPDREAAIDALCLVMAENAWARDEMRSPDGPTTALDDDCNDPVENQGQDDTVGGADVCTSSPQFEGGLEVEGGSGCDVGLEGACLNDDLRPKQADGPIVQSLLETLGFELCDPRMCDPAS